MKQSQDILSFDESAVLVHFQGIESVLLQVGWQFVESLPEFEKSIDVSFHLQDRANLERSAHTLKGAVSNFYAEKCRSMLFQLEKGAKNLSWPELQTLWDQVKTELQNFIRVFKVFLESRAAA